MIRSLSCLYYAFGTCNDNEVDLSTFILLSILIRSYLNKYKSMCWKCKKLTRVNLPDIVKIPDITLPSENYPIPDLTWSVSWIPNQTGPFPELSEIRPQDPFFWGGCTDWSGDPRLAGVIRSSFVFIWDTLEIHTPLWNLAKFLTGGVEMSSEFAHLMLPL